MPAQNKELKLNIADWCKDFMEGDYRFCITPHGRASGTTYNYSSAFIEKCKNTPNYVIIILRDFKTDANDSALRTIRTILQQHNIEHTAPISKQHILFPNGSIIECLGTELNPEALKGKLDAADICYFEECHRLREDQWLIFEPTIRKPGSKIILNWNPQVPTEYPWRMFTEPQLTYPFKTLRIKLTYRNNPWLPKEVALQIERAKLPGHEELNAAYEGDFPAHGDFFDIAKINELGPAELAEWYTEEAAPQIMRFRSWDTAYDGGPQNDNTVGLLIARWNEKYLIEDIYVGKLNPHQVKEMILAYAEKDQCPFGIETIKPAETYVDGILDEAIANGYHGKKLLPLQRSKPERAALAAAIMGRGLMYVDKDADWLPALKSELYIFPKEKHGDDRVDGLAYGTEELATALTGEFRLYGATKIEDLNRSKNDTRPDRVEMTSWYW